ncbi:RHS repeat domain-containing protein [Promicromonospora sp. NPDC050880]|uniref:RHS repeat domain-containing protein n=1 Tax=Promicromonospora sp. NPDC050880 TaxID=3364406 RepID=UPI00379C3CF3
MADPLDGADRESWSVEERRAHGRELLDENTADEATESDIPVREIDATAPSHLPGGDEAGATAQEEPVTIEWPDAGAAVMDVPTVGESSSSAHAGGLSVDLRAVRGKSRAAVAEDARRVQVTHEPRDVAERLGAVGGVVRVEATGEGTSTTADASNGRATAAGDVPARVGLDVSHLADAGADLASRLTLVRLPVCALTTPEVKACQERTPVSEVRLEGKGGDLTLSGQIDLPAAAAPDTEATTASGTVSPRATERAAQVESEASAAVVLAVVAEESGPNGDWGATSLDSSAAWAVGGSTGGFTWAEPLRTPDVPGGLTPQISLSYSSQAVDGKVASGNVQSSMVGDGWEANLSGYVERKYVPCTEDQTSGANNISHDTGDLCWKTNNATLVFNGSATELVRASGGVWRPKNDDNTLVERVEGGWGDSHEGEYWVVTTDDGTRYYFGRGKVASDGAALNSVFQVPVYGNHPGEPCYASAFADSQCGQAWRWNLDYVEDVRGNTMTYKYTRYGNKYGYDNNSGVASYSAGGRLVAIEYGTRTGETTPSARVAFTYAERCIPTSTFDCAVSKRTVANSAYWPDLPLDQFCSSTTTCPDVQAPVFYDRERLTTITTQVRKSGALVPVESWELTQSLPSVGATMPTLWLDRIEHTGMGATADTADDVTLVAGTEFDAVQLANRVATPGGDETAMTRLRISRVRSSSGGQIAVAYSGKECTTSNVAGLNPWQNTKRCFPVFWTRPATEEQVEEYFHHYRVQTVTEGAGDAIGGAPKVTTYQYTGGPAWHHDDNDLVRPKHRTWGELRGYSRVDTYVGDTETPGAPRLHTATRYFRGMHGDQDARSDTSVRKSVPVDEIYDLDQYAGMVREQITFDGSTQVESTVSTPWTSNATATDTEGITTSAYHTGVQATETTVPTPEAARSSRVTRVQIDLDDTYGMPQKVVDHGDVAVSGDETCTWTTYARNLGANMLTLVRRQVKVAADQCDQDDTPVEAEAISDVRYAYDGGAVGDAPTRGLLTRSEELDRYSAGSPVYMPVERTVYEEPGVGYARPVRILDAKDRATVTAYTDSADGLNTRTTVTTPDPDGSGPLAEHETVTDLEPAWGVPVKVTDPDGKVTSGSYDVFGRLKQVWKPGRVKGTDTPHTKYTYVLRASGLNAVTTQTLNSDASGYLTSVDILDGLLRSIQTQTPSADERNPGRVLHDTAYDSRGLAVFTDDGWYNSSAPSGSALAIPTKAVPARTYREYDGAGRVVDETFHVGEDGAPNDHGYYDPTWTTTTSYAGDRVHVDPPQGGTPTTTINDAHGNTTQLRQYEGDGPSGTSHTTRYSYDDADRLIGVSDPAGNTWSYDYDLRGRQTLADDPDKGRVITTYDEVGNVLTTTDARGQVLGYTYDNLNRKTTLRSGGVDGTVRSRWAYDTVSVGQLASSTRVQNGEYTTAVTGYSPEYQPLGQRVTLPNDDSLGALKGQSYTTTYTYNPDGRLSDTFLPAAGNLPAEQTRLFYDAANQPSWLSGAGDFDLYVVGSNWSTYGQLEYMDLGGPFSYQYALGYEYGTRRLLDVRQSVEKADGTVPAVLNTTYAWDKAGNLVSAKDNPHTGGGRAPDRQCFTYDWAGRLAQAWTPAGGDCTAARSVSALGGADPYWNSYTYEVTGNRETVTARTPGGTTTAQYAHPTQGVDSVRPHAVSSVTTTGQTAGTSEFNWDASGSMTGRSMPDGQGGLVTQSLTWDAEGELASVGQDGNADGDVADAGEAIAGGQYVYTADGERLVRAQGSGTGRTVTVYLPGGQEVTASASGQVSAVRYYSFAGKTIAMRTGMLLDETFTITPDHHGTGSLQITYQSGTVTRRYTDPFGAERGTAGPTVPGAGDVAGWAGDHGFLDKPADSTGLTAVGARMYDPGLGVFVSVDPVMDLADPQQWHGYAYAHSNPTTFSDPTGLRETCESGWSCDYGSGGEIVDAERVREGRSGASDSSDNTDPPVTASGDGPSVELDAPGVPDAGDVIEGAKGFIDEYIPEDISKEKGWRWAFWDAWNASTRDVGRGVLAYSLIGVLVTWSGYCGDGFRCLESSDRFWLAAAQAGNETGMALIYGAAGAAGGAGAASLLGAGLGTLGMPGPGTLIGGAGGLALGGAIGGLAGSGAGVAAARIQNRNLARQILGKRLAI